MAPNPLSFTDIGWFVHLTGRPLSPWEVEMIERMDDAAIASSSKTAAAAAATPQPELIPASDVSSIRALFRSKAAERKAGA
jgi:hypothetical protein